MPFSSYTLFVHVLISEAWLTMLYIRMAAMMHSMLILRAVHDGLFRTLERLRFSYFNLPVTEDSQRYDRALSAFADLGIL